MNKNNNLKTIDCINDLLKDLYIDLRKKVNYWSSLTNQTAQARMGYIGQHLVSVVTGFKGSKSGARGKDLILSATEYAEIKTCSRVDQLGLCKHCKSPVSSTEIECPNCHSKDIERKDDSKWLISITEEYPSKNALDDSEDILVNINKPKYYYFVLFEFKDLKKTDSPIVVTIYRVEPKFDGFTLCMIDYFYNIKNNAPFNMWPHMLKFNLCYPEIIYRSEIDSIGNIHTYVFNNEEPLIEPFDKLVQYARGKNLTESTLRNLCEEFNQPISNTAKDVLKNIESYAANQKMNNKTLVTKFCHAFYKEGIEKAKKRLAEEGKSIPSVFSEYVDTL